MRCYNAILILQFVSNHMLSKPYWPHLLKQRKEQIAFQHHMHVVSLKRDPTSPPGSVICEIVAGVQEENSTFYFTKIWNVSFWSFRYHITCSICVNNDVSWRSWRLRHVLLDWVLFGGVVYPERYWLVCKSVKHTDFLFQKEMPTYGIKSQLLRCSLCTRCTPLPCCTDIWPPGYFCSRTLHRLVWVRWWSDHWGNLTFPMKNCQLVRELQPYFTRFITSSCCCYCVLRENVTFGFTGF